MLGSSRPAWQRFALAVLLSVVPIALTLAQPDLSTTTLLAVLAGSMLAIGRVPLRFLMPLLAGAAVSAPLVIGLLRPYQVERLGTFLIGAHESPTGSGWAVRQAHIAVGSGTWFGRTDDPLRGSGNTTPNCGPGCAPAPGPTIFQGRPSPACLPSRAGPACPG